MIKLGTWRATLLARSDDLFCALSAERRILMNNAGWSDSYSTCFVWFQVFHYKTVRGGSCWFNLFVVTSAAGIML